MADNSVTLVGNLTREPELRFTNGGRAVATFGMAVNRRYQVNGEWQEQTSFFNVVAWGQLGENAAQSLSRAAAPSSPVASSSASTRPGTGSSATSSRSSPTNSVRACAGRPPRSKRPVARRPKWRRCTRSGCPGQPAAAAARR